MRFPSRRAFASVILLVATQTVFAQTPKTVFLEDLTWTELRDQIQAGKTTIIIPIGGTEQSGPDVALGKHNARVKVLSQRIAEGLATRSSRRSSPMCRKAATLRRHRTCVSRHHHHAGRCVRKDARIRGEQLRGARLHQHRLSRRPRRLPEDIQHVVAHLNKSWAGSSARAFVPPAYYGTSSDGYAQILRQHGVRDDEIGTHAGLADTSLQLAVAPQMVRLDQLRTGPKLGPADGVYGGDPRRSSAELGRLGIDAIVSRTVDAIRKETAGR